MDAGKPFHVNIFVGGNPAMTVAAVMPLPEGMSELTFAGALAGHRIQMVKQNDAASIYAQADFCIRVRLIHSDNCPRDLLVIISVLQPAHDFPVLNVKSVYHRKVCDLAIYGGGSPSSRRYCVWRVDPRMTGR